MLTTTFIIIVLALQVAFILTAVVACHLRTLPTLTDAALYRAECEGDDATLAQLIAQTIPTVARHKSTEGIAERLHTLSLPTIRGAHTYHRSRGHWWRYHALASPVDAVLATITVGVERVHTMIEDDYQRTLAS